jgi:tape measure domain-containing protein
MAQAEIRITADTAQARIDIDRLTRSLDSIEGSSRRAERSLGTLSNVAGLAAGAFAALTAGIGLREIADYTARWTDLNSRLINATGSSENAEQALRAISASARGTYSSLEQTAEVFLRNSMAMNELGYTTNEQIKVSTALNNAMAVSGARGDQAASALDAFAKSVARGKMEGEDFNRIIENAPELVKALADGLGVTTGEFRKMITEGKITSEQMIPALISQMDELQKKADEMPATISDGFILLQNSLFEFIGRADKALGISQKLAAGMKFLSENIEMVIGAIAGLGVAALGLAAALLPAATLMTILTGGAVLLGAAAIGAFLAKAAKEAGLFSFMAEKAVDPMEAQKKAAEDAAAATARQALAAKRLVEEQNKGLKGLFDKLAMENASIGANATELAIKKNIAEAARILKVEEGKIAQSVRQRIEDETRAIILKRQTHEITKMLTDLDTERIGLAIQDKDQREIILAIRRLELQFGRELTASERERLTTGIQLTQQAREQAKIAEAMLEHTRAQTELEKLQRGIRLQSTVDPRSDLEKQYRRDLEALDAYHKAANTSTADALNQRAVLEEEFQYRLLQLQNQDLQNYDRINKLKEQMDYERIERTLMQEQRGMAAVLSEQDQAVLQRRGAEERQAAIVRDRIEFEKKSDLEKTQFAIGNLQSVFAALGAQNKKAFEASKALAIASALVNTYQGATKALATYPWPFGLIAAAAAVAAGLAQVSAIRSQQYSGRALGGPVMGGTPYIVGESGPELFVPNTTGSITRNGDLQGGKAVTVNFSIIANDTTGFDELLTSRRGVITQIISDAMLERGQRSML